MFGTNTNKYHIMIVILFLFSENENCDTKVIIHAKRESYRNRNICQINRNIISFFTISFSPPGQYRQVRDVLYDCGYHVVALA